MCLLKNGGAKFLRGAGGFFLDRIVLFFFSLILCMRCKSPINKETDRQGDCVDASNDGRQGPQKRDGHKTNGKKKTSSSVIWMRIHVGSAWRVQLRTTYVPSMNRAAHTHTHRVLHRVQLDTMFCTADVDAAGFGGAGVFVRAS